jgi:hypothetical protein
MRRLNMHLRGGGGGGIFFFLFQCVPLKFPRDFPSGEILKVMAQDVPKVFHKRFAIAPQFYPICFGHSSTSVYIYRKKGKGQN